MNANDISRLYRNGAFNVNVNDNDVEIDDDYTYMDYLRDNGAWINSIGQLIDSNGFVIDDDEVK